MEKTIVDILYEDFLNLNQFLIKNEEPSFTVLIDDHFRKSLLLSSASFFEYQICNILTEYFHNTTNSNLIITSFLKNKAISRQYHTFFCWDAANANNFFALFGEKFKNHMTAIIKDNEKLESSIKDFMEIGRERNRLVHQNYANYTIEKTVDEIFNLFKSAQYFMEIFNVNINSVSN
ncbi:MAG: hypothetical protein HOO91_18330 [Bacteroidales bacterium]|nr:hypothetical protein [Bacteroidales bacterium]